MAIPRGIRNHNPLNIRRSKDQWKGMAEVQTDRAFVQFKSLEYGWRAAFYLLTRTYYHKYRLYTIRTIIRRWAPASENNTEAYIQNVSKLTGILPDEPLGIPSEQPSRWMLSALRWPSKRPAHRLWTTSPCCEDGNFVGKARNPLLYCRRCTVMVCRRQVFFQFVFIVMFRDIMVQSAKVANKKKK